MTGASGYIDLARASASGGANGSETPPSVAITAAADPVLDAGWVLVALLILACNLPVVVTVLRSRLRHLPAFILLLGLSSADMCVAVPCLWKLALPLHTRPRLCLVYVAFFVAPICASVLFMLCIALDRMIAISTALTYNVKVTKTRACVAVTATWAWAFVVGCGPLLGWRKEPFVRCSFMHVVHENYVYAIFVAGQLVPLLLIILIYIRIFLVTRNHIRSIARIENTFSAGAADDITATDVTASQLELPSMTRHVNKMAAAMKPVSAERSLRRRISALRRTLKALLTLAVVIGCFMVTWLPFTIASLVQNACGMACHLEDVIGTYLLLLGCANSFLNPIIYAYWNKEFRQLLVSSFRLCRIRRGRVKPLPRVPHFVISAHR